MFHPLGSGGLRHHNIRRAQTKLTLITRNSDTILLHMSNGMLDGTASLHVTATLTQFSLSDCVRRVLRR
ncbi:hypothetical protein FKM82_011715 [Ascaphus truei]